LSECTVTIPPGASIADHLAAGGVLCLQAGMYDGALFLEKSVEIRGVPGTIIDAGGRGAALRVGTDDVVAIVSNVELRGGHGELGAGVRLDGYSDLTLRDCTIAGNKPTQGGAAVGASKGTLRVSGGHIDGGMLLTGIVEATLTKPEIEGGLRVRDGANVTVTGGRIGGEVDVAGTTTRAPKVSLAGTSLSEPIKNDEENPGTIAGP
jgi:hypothetical protein